MTRDEIVQIAWDVGLFMRSHKFQDEPTKLEQFAERIAAAEREACALLCDEKYEAVPASDPYAEADGDYSELIYAEAAQDCAAAIRARGEA